MRDKIAIMTILLIPYLFFLILLINKSNSKKENKPQEIKKESQLQKQLDSLLIESKQKDDIIKSLYKSLNNKNEIFDSLIIKNNKNGESKKNDLHHYNNPQLIHWNDSVLSANNINRQ